MTSMAPFFNVAPRFAMPELPGLPVSEEDRQRALLRNAYDSAAPRGPVPAMMNALSALRDMPEAAPAPRMVSGGDVIGLMPEQSAALMDRIQRQNEIDQQMYQQRSLQSREEAMTREGRVMSAREAQQRRAQEFAIEQAKLDREDERDKAKMSRPTYQPISSNPGYLMKIQTNPDTNEVSAEVVKAGGVAIPDKPTDPNAHGTWVTTYGPDGVTPVRKFIQATGDGVVIAPNPSSDPNDAARLNAINARAKFFAGYGWPDGNGGVTPMSPTQATALAQAEYDDQPPADGIVDYSGLVPVPKVATPRLGLGPDNTYQEIVPGAKGPDPAITQKPSEDLLRVAFKDNWNDRDTSTQEKVNYLWSHGKSPEEIARVLGPPSEDVDGWFGPYKKDRYSVPTVAPQGAAQPAPATAAPQGKRMLYTDDNGKKIPGVLLPDGMFQPD